MKRENAIDEFATRELQLAVPLKILHCRLVRLDWRVNGDALFIFADRAKCEGIVRRYWQDELQIEAKAYFVALREIKDRLFEETRTRRMK